MESLGNLDQLREIQDERDKKILTKDISLELTRVETKLTQLVGEFAGILGNDMTLSNIDTLKSVATKLLGFALRIMNILGAETEENMWDVPKNKDLIPPKKLTIREAYNTIMEANYLFHQKLLGIADLQIQPDRLVTMDSQIELSIIPSLISSAWVIAHVLGINLKEMYLNEFSKSKE